MLTEREADAGLDVGVVRRIGRFDEGHLRWSASAVEVRFHGAALALDLRVPAPPAPRAAEKMPIEQTVPYAVFVDGHRAADLQVGAHRRRYLVANGLASADHVVRVVRESEAKAGVHTLTGVVLPNGGTFLPPKARPRRIDVVGDSIACGYGVLGANETCGFSYATERATAAWPYLLGEALDADVVVQCWSGRGVHRNYEGTTERTMIDLAVAPPPDDRPPDVVIVALGTNDFLSPAATPDDVRPGGPFEARFVAFLAEVRRWTRGPIVVAGSPMLSAEPLRRLARAESADDVLRGIVTQARQRDRGVHFVPLPFQGRELGCDWHPNAAVQRMAAAAMKDALTAPGFLWNPK